MNFENKNFNIKITISLLFYEPNTSTMFTEKSVTICKQPKYHTHLQKQFARPLHRINHVFKPNLSVSRKNHNKNTASTIPTRTPKYTHSNNKPTLQPTTRPNRPLLHNHQLDPTDQGRTTDLNFVKLDRTHWGSVNLR